MKLAYLGPYKDKTRQANSIINNILACESVGINVACRPISLSQNPDIKSCPIVHLEDNNLQDIDAVIQHISPYYYQYKKGIKNIGFFQWETYNFRHQNWIRSCNMMDEIWVSYQSAMDSLVEYGVQRPIKIIPSPCDIHQSDPNIKPMEYIHDNSKFIFYTIVNLDRKDNLPSLIRTFYATFNKKDDVILLIKINNDNNDQKQNISTLKKIVNEIKKATHIYKNQDYYPKIITIANQMDKREIKRLHTTCHCFVLPSHGNTYPGLAQDAMCFGNPIIVSNDGCFCDLITQNETDGGFLIEGHRTFCFGMMDNPPELYTGLETWFEPNLEELRNQMLYIYNLWFEDKNKFRTISNNAYKRVCNFSHNAVGQLIKKTLET